MVFFHSFSIELNSGENLGQAIDSQAFGVRLTELLDRLAAMIRRAVLNQDKRNNPPVSNSFIGLAVGLTALIAMSVSGSLFGAWTGNALRAEGRMNTGFLVNIASDIPQFVPLGVGGLRCGSTVSVRPLPLRHDSLKRNRKRLFGARAGLPGFWREQVKLLAPPGPSTHLTARFNRAATSGHAQRRRPRRQTARQTAVNTGLSRPRRSCH